MEWALNRKKRWMVLVGSSLVLVQVFVNTSGCFREEKRSLLELKTAYSNHSLLPSWVDDDDDPNSNCCDWERVECDPFSGYVFNLSLSNIRDRDAYGRCFSTPFNWSLLFTFPQLTTLDLSHNCFQNFVCQGGLCQMKQIEELYLNDNDFEGTLDPLMKNMTSLRTLDLSHNLLSGSIPASIAMMRSLRILNLRHNNFSGSIPVNMFEGRDTSAVIFTHPVGLHILDLSHNKFSGHLPFSFTISPSLVFINLKGNNLTGKIPNYYPGGNNIVAIDFSDNNFKGHIPESIYSLESLTFLLLAGNQLQEQLSSGICELRNLQILDLSRNKFTGSIPSCFNNIAFQDVNFVFSHGQRATASPGGAKRYSTQIFGFKYRMGEVQVVTKGSSRSYEGDTLKIMSALDLSSNQLSGEIPRELGDLSSLHALNLSHNRLNGSIPESFHNLQNIESLDLSNNSLSGKIPLDLQDLYSLEIFNVSYNNLSGTAPEENQFANFDDSNYEGNPFLHWTNSNRRIPPSPTPLDKRKKDDSVIDFASFYWTFSASYVTVLLALVIILWINPYWRRVWFYFVEWCRFKCFR